MFKGVLFALAACFVWGLIFIIPHLTHNFDPFETALGRHFVYGSFSLIFFLYYKFKVKVAFSTNVWRRAFFCGLMANVVYYSCVVTAVRYSSPALTALLLGLGPITISLYGNWREKECDFHKLILPSILIVAGLLLVNAPFISTHTLELTYLIGALAALVSLAVWSWYVVANTRFLKDHPEISAQQWSTLMGTGTFVWVLFLGIIYELWLGKDNLAKFSFDAPEVPTFVAGCLVLGIICSFFGTFFWNNASTRLPVAFAGQLTIFETIFGLLFFYLAEQSVPPPLEIAGIVLMLGAIFYGINTFAVEAKAAEAKIDS